MKENKIELAKNLLELWVEENKKLHEATIKALEKEEVDFTTISTAHNMLRQQRQDIISLTVQIENGLEFKPNKENN